MADERKSSSRASLTGGNLQKVFTFNAVPRDPESLHLFLQNEFTFLSGMLSGFQQGELFPLMTELPKRTKEGLCVIFTEKIVDSDGVVLIPEPGLYLFLNKKWNKIPLTPVG